MTVSELIEELQKLDQDKKVVYWDNYKGDKPIDTVFIDNNRCVIN
jgi:hypothetical protein